MENTQLEFQGPELQVLCDCYLHMFAKGFTYIPWDVFQKIIFFYLLLFCFCESCVMRVLQSKGVANHRETYRDPDGTNKNVFIVSRPHSSSLIPNHT